jgi:hypothetical protein
MTRVCGALVLVAILASAIPAGAQTAASDMPAGPIVNSWYLGANGGTAVVEKFGGVAAAEGGLRFWKSLDAVGELVWIQNGVTRRQLDQVGTIVTALNTTQGGGASGSMKVPMTYGGIGARWVFESGTVRPYIIATVGGARVNRKSSFALGGADITGSLAQYRVTLGQDLAGEYNQVATSGGMGIVMGIGTFYVDVGVRMLSTSGAGQRTNVARLVLGGGYRF